MARWYITDGTTETTLPGGLEPVPNAYFPLPELQPFRAPGGSTVHYEGDGLPKAEWFTLAGGIITAADGYALYAKLAALQAALNTATHLKRDGDGASALTWSLKVGTSHLYDTQPVDHLSHVWSGGIRFGLGSGSLVGGSALETFYLLTEDADTLSYA